MPDGERIRELLARPAESLNVELKTWLDPRNPEGVEKIIKSIFALRNRNGGFLIIGYNNKTATPDLYSGKEDVRSVFHFDYIQSLISRYASDPFEVEVAFGQHSGQYYPVIFVSEGVKVPVVIKRDFRVDGGKYLLREGDIYFRTLGANGTASSAKLKPSDIGDLMEICFENREADIGRFLRRHLSGDTLITIASALNGQLNAPQESLQRRAETLLEKGEAAFFEAIRANPLPAEKTSVLSALTLRVGLALNPSRFEALPTQEFLNKVAAGNPQYTGWPVWLDSRNFRNAADRPYVKDDAWQALIADLNGGWSQHLEFMLLDAKGMFFLRRVMQDDLSDKVNPGEEMDVILMIYRVVEILATGLSIAQSCGWSESNDNAGFLFRWTGLKGRKLSSWVNALIYNAWGSSPAQDNDAVSYVEIPADTPASALGPHVSQAIAPLFTKFGGYVVSAKVVEDCVKKLLERRL
jgi:hypothetical protein